MPLPKNAVTLLSSQGGVGKTRLALIAASKHAKQTSEKIALWLTEDFPGQVRYVFEQLCEEGIAYYETMQNLMLILDEPPQLAKREKGIFKANYEQIAKIGEELIAKGATFAVFDPLLAFYGGNENDNSEARVFIQAFAEWAKLSQVTTLIIHHAGKDGRTRGASAFHDGVRARYELSIPKDAKGEVDEELFKKGLRVLSLKKDNWGVSIPFYRLSEGKDNLLVKVAPPLEEQYVPKVELPYV